MAFPSEFRVIQHTQKKKYMHVYVSKQGFPKFIGMTANDDDDVGKLSEGEQKEVSVDVFFDKPVETSTKWLIRFWRYQECFA